MSTVVVLATFTRLLAMPAGAGPVAILCLGHMDAFYPRPMLEQERWASRQALGGLVFENRWNNAASTLLADDT